MPNTIIELSTAEDLLHMAQNIRNGFYTGNITYSLQKDISLSGILWKPIPHFHGIFEGNKHYITDLSIVSNTENELAFFHSVEEKAIIRELGLINCTIHGCNLVSGLTAYSDGTIINCCVSGDFSAENQAAAAIVGRANHGVIQSCCAMATIRSSVGAGGICTYLGNNNSTAKIINCKFSGTIISSGSSDPICGVVYNGSQVSDCTTLFEC